MSIVWIVIGLIALIIVEQLLGKVFEGVFGDIFKNPWVIGVSIVVFLAIAVFATTRDTNESRFTYPVHVVSASDNQPIGQASVKIGSGKSVQVSTSQVANG